MASTASKIAIVLSLCQLGVRYPVKGAEPLCGHYRYDDPVNYRGRDLAAYEVIATIPAPAVLISILSAFSNGAPHVVMRAYGGATRNSTATIRLSVPLRAGADELELLPTLLNRIQGSGFIAPRCPGMPFGLSALRRAGIAKLS